MRFKSLSAILIILAMVCGCAPKEEMSRVIPMEDFFKNPEVTGFSLSPDGSHLAFIKPWKTRLNVFVRKVGEDKETRVSGATERDISGYFWANNNRIGFIQDIGGDENFNLYAVNIDGTEEKALTPFEKVQVQVVDEMENDEDHILISMNKRDARVFDVYRIDINSGELEMIAQNPGNITGWMTDHDGNLRIAVTTDGVNTSVLYRDTEKEDFRILITTNFKETLSPLFFSFDNKNLYVASNLGRDKTAVYEYDIAKKETTKLLFEHDEVDVSSLLKSDKRKVVTGVAYVTDKRHYHFFDKEREDLQINLEGRLPGYEVIVSDSSKDETKILVRTFSDRYG